MKNKLVALLLMGSLLCSAAGMSACNQKDDSKDTDAATDEHTETSTQVVTEAPTEVPTEAPTEAPTEVATEAPTDSVETTVEGNLKTLNGKTPAEVYQNLMDMNKRNCESNIEMTVVMDMDTGDGTSMHVEMTEKVLMKLDDGNVYTKTESTDITGERVVEEQWYVDGKLYREIYDENLEPVKVYTNMTPEEAEEYYDMDAEDNTFMPMPEAWLTELSFEKVEEDLYALSLDIDADMLASLDEDFDLGDLTGEDMTFNTMRYTVYLHADGSLAYLFYSVDLEVMGVTCAASVTVHLTGLGSTRVTAPENADQYVPYETPDLTE